MSLFECGWGDWVPSLLTFRSTGYEVGLAMIGRNEETTTMILESRTNSHALTEDYPAQMQLTQC